LFSQCPVKEVEGFSKRYDSRLWVRALVGDKLVSNHDVKRPGTLGLEKKRKMASWDGEGV
jgi:hypothetical protein